MEHLSIVQDLFESDTVKILLAGVIFSVLTGLMRKSTYKKCFIRMGIGLVIYGLCELYFLVGTQYATAFLCLFAGTFALGFIPGQCICILIVYLRRKQNTYKKGDYE